MEEFFINATVEIIYFSDVLRTVTEKYVVDFHTSP